MSDVSAPACTNEVWPPLRPVSVAQKNKPSTMLSSSVQSIDHLMDCTTRRFWTMRQSNGCSIRAPKSSAAMQWVGRTRQKKKKNSFHSLNYWPILTILPSIGIIGILWCFGFRQVGIIHLIIRARPSLWLCILKVFRCSQAHSMCVLCRSEYVKLVDMKTFEAGLARY